jgi:hypothetical protein
LARSFRFLHVLLYRVVRTRNARFQQRISTGIRAAQGVCRQADRHR